MKPDENKEVSECTEKSDSVTGDAIGDTAYSQRFVLKLLLKLANLDTLKDEIQEKSFEDDMCTLWDMTAERDVVLFLHKHNVLNLFHFALPVVDSQRMIEIFIGIVGNMSCQAETVAALIKKHEFLTLLMEYIRSDNSSILIQLLRLLNACLFLVPENHVTIWMDQFITNDYSSALYFILKNSSNKDLLLTAMENFNTICSYCNVEKSRTNFFTHFVKPEAIESLSAALIEITVNQKDSFEKEDIERTYVISLQIILILVGFDKSREIFAGSKDDVIAMISFIICYYENKLIKQKEIDTDLIEIITSTNTVMRTLDIGGYEMDKYFNSCLKMWNIIKNITKIDENGSTFEEEDLAVLKDFSKRMKTPLSTLMCIYLYKCSDTNLQKVMDAIGDDFNIIKSFLKDKTLLADVSIRTANFSSPIISDS